MTTPKPVRKTTSTPEGETRTGHERSAESRRLILAAAIAEFAEAGEAGARMERIAQAAGVNKALLHYHYRDKQGLYQAAIDAVFGGLKERQMAVLARPEASGERALRFLLSHFDYLTSNPSHPKMIGQEMMRAKRGGFEPLRRLIAHYMTPVSQAMHATLQEGMASGELRQFDARQFTMASIGSNIFYVISAPVTRSVFHESTNMREVLEQRRAALLDFAAATIYADRGRGMKTAQKILRETPLTETAVRLGAPPHSPTAAAPSPKKTSRRRGA